MMLKSFKNIVFGLVAASISVSAVAQDDHGELESFRCVEGHECYLRLVIKVVCRRDEGDLFEELVASVEWFGRADEFCEIFESAFGFYRSFVT